MTKTAEAREELETAIVRIERAMELLGLFEGKGESSFREEMRGLMKIDPEAAIDVCFSWRNQVQRMRDKAKKAGESFLEEMVERLDLDEEQAEELGRFVAEISEVTGD